MDVDRILAFLRAEKARLDRVIRSLEELQAITSHRGTLHKRGRTSMGEEERREVSGRMKKFWAERRKKHPTRS